MEALPMLRQEVVIVKLVIVLENLALDLRRVHPSHKVLQVPRDMERWIRDGVWPHPHMTLGCVHQ